MSSTKDKQAGNKSEQPVGKPKKKSNPYVLPIGGLVIAGVCMPYIYYAVMVNIKGSANAPKDYKFPDLRDYWKVLVGAAVTQVVRSFMYYFGYNIFFPVAKGEGEERVKYTQKCCEFAFRSVYFLSAAIWGWSVLKDCPQLYKSLGGPEGGSPSNVPLDSLSIIFEEYSPALYDYSLYTWGFHFGNFVQHTFFDEHGSDFPEMLLHHIAANCLFFSYISGNIMTFGSMVAYLHDLADVPASISKTMASTRFEKTSIAVGLTMMVTWFWTRIYLLPLCIYHIFSTTVMQESLPEFSQYVYFSGIFLSIMCALHYMWFAMFFKILYRFAVTGTANADYNAKKTQ